MRWKMPRQTAKIREWGMAGNSGFRAVSAWTPAEDELLMDLEGLFPRVRGNYQHVLELDRCLGSIPARAGEPPLRQIQNRIKMVYPRACGGTNEKSGMGNVASGLSPRVRGNLQVGIALELHYGSIPARAGEP